MSTGEVTTPKLGPGMGKSENGLAWHRGGLVHLVAGLDWAQTTQSCGGGALWRLLWGLPVCVGPQCLELVPVQDAADPAWV